jgi:HK97 gp10 family phage protein
VGDGANVTWVGLKDLYAALETAQKDADAASKEIVTQGAALIQKKAQANFEGSHRKGQPHTGGDHPNVVTGYLRRSIRMTPVTSYGAGTWGTTVGPTSVYGRRVELGFRGTDSLGRRYNQPAFPYFTPAVEEVTPDLEELAANTWRGFLMT